MANNTCTIRGKYYLQPLRLVPTQYLMWAYLQHPYMSAGMEQRLMKELDKRRQKK